MALLGNLLKNGIRLSNVVRLRKFNALRQQRKVFRKLIRKAQFTKFGATYHFDDLLRSAEFGTDKEFYTKYKEYVPIHRLQQDVRWVVEANAGGRKERSVAGKSKILRAQFRYVRSGYEVYSGDESHVESHSADEYSSDSDTRKISESFPRRFTKKAA